MLRAARRRAVARKANRSKSTSANDNYILTSKKQHASPWPSDALEVPRHDHGQDNSLLDQALRLLQASNVIPMHIGIHVQHVALNSGDEGAVGRIAIGIGIARSPAWPLASSIACSAFPSARMAILANLLAKDLGQRWLDGCTATAATTTTNWSPSSSTCSASARTDGAVARCASCA